MMSRSRGRRPLWRYVALAGSAVVTAALAVAPAGEALAAPDPASTCRLGPDGAVRHVVYIQFDNTHLRRDKPGVPSDLEQMPHLLNFMKDNGTLLSNDHTVLISHTAGGILSSLTGVYPDRHGQTVSNSYVRYNGAGFQFPSSFGYWTDPATATTQVPNMVTPDGSNAPAPWVPFTRAGCDFGAVATANTVLENTGTGPSGDITKVFGNPSPQASEASASAAAPAGSAARSKAQTDFVGFAVHCGQSSATCAGGQDDLLPAEPGGYTGYKGLFGAQEVDPVLTGRPADTPLTDLLGSPITDPFGQPGFPGFDGMSAATSLAYSAAMQEKGIPVTYAYISDAHDFHGVAGNAHSAFGPGSAGYVAQLRSYDAAFAAFFQRLAHDGLTKNNTMFVFTVDEGDHFVGGTPAPANCDGVSVPCDWTGQVGEINTNIDTLMSKQHPEITTPFTVHGDDAPTFYLSGNPGQNDPATRAFERAAGSLTAVNPYTGATDPLLAQLADQAEMKLLHMYTTGDPTRNATFTFFGDPDYFITDFPASTCETCINPAFAWNHGDIQPEIANTWLGFVGPGVRHLGQTGAVWTDHTDVRPTMLTALGLSDDYQHDGRTIVEALRPGAVPRSLAAHDDTVSLLGATYKQLNAPFGLVGMSSLRVASRGVLSDSANDARYHATDALLAGWTARRDALAGQISAMLNAAEFGGRPIDVRAADRLIARSTALIAEVWFAGR
jgi:hypothetical protein